MGKFLPIAEFLKPFPDFHDWTGKKQVDYLAYYTTLEDGGGRLAIEPDDIEEAYSEIPLTAYNRIQKYLSEESLKRNGKYVKRSGLGYLLSKPTADEIVRSLGKSPRKDSASTTLNGLQRKVKDVGESSLLDEAILCLDIGAYRAAVVMMWALTMAHLRNKTLIEVNLLKFNNAIDQWNLQYPKAKTKEIASYDEFGDITEHRFISFLRSAKIITKTQDEILEAKLKIRNSAGHPTGTKIGENKVAEFIEDLVNNILS